MELRKTKKVKYEVRCLLDGNISMKESTHTDKTEAIDLAKHESKKENGRMWFVKKIISEVVFVVDKRK